MKLPLKYEQGALRDADGFVINVRSRAQEVARMVNTHGELVTALREMIEGVEQLAAMLGIDTAALTCYRELLKRAEGDE